MTSRTLDNLQDIIDSREVIARIDELETELASCADEDARAELATLCALAAEADGSPDWQYGEALIRESYFEEYAQELAEDCGMVQAGAPWPINCIDWEEAADQLKQDYMGVDFDGITYWIRA